MDDHAGSAAATDRSAEPSSESPSLRRDRLGVTFIVFFVVAAAAPLVGTTGALPGQIALGNGAAAPGAYVVAGLTLLLFSVGYIAMTAKVTNAGAFFAYVGRGLGVPIGVGSAFISTVAYFGVQLAVYGFLGTVVRDKMADLLGVHQPWWFWSLVAWVLVLVLSLLQVDVGARILGTLMLLELLSLAIVSVAVLAKGGPEGVSLSASFSPGHVFAGGFAGSAGIALSFAFASFIGFEATAIYGEETRDPKRNVPRATYAAVGVITLVFALSGFAVVSALGPGQVVEQVMNISSVNGEPLGNPPAVLYSVTDHYVGTWLSSVMSWLVLSSVFASVVALQNCASRYLFAMGRAGVLPSALRRVNGRGAPDVAAATTSAIGLAVILLFAATGKDPVLDLFFPFGGLAVISIVLVEILVSIAVVVSFRRDGDGQPVWSTLVAPVLATLGLGVALYLLISRFGLLAGTVPAGVDPTRTALTLSTEGWVLVLLPFVLLIAGSLVGRVQARSENAAAVADFVS